MTDNKTLINRMKVFAKEKKGSILNFEIACGFTEGYIKSINQKSSAFGIDKLVQIYTLFPDLNLKWLLTGDGDMLEKEVTGNNHTNIQNNKSGDNNIGAGEYVEKIKHLQEMLAEKEKRIILLERLLDKP